MLENGKTIYIFKKLPSFPFQHLALILFLFLSILLCEKHIVSILRSFLESEENSFSFAGWAWPTWCLLGNSVHWVETRPCVCHILAILYKCSQHQVRDRTAFRAGEGGSVCPLRVPEVIFLNLPELPEAPGELCLLFWVFFTPLSVTFVWEQSVPRCLCMSLATCSSSLRNSIFWVTDSVCHLFLLLFTCLLLRGLW